MYHNYYIYSCRNKLFEKKNTLKEILVNHQGINFAQPTKPTYVHPIWSPFFLSLSISLSLLLSELMGSENIDTVSFAHAKFNHDKGYFDIIQFANWYFIEYHEINYGVLPLPRKLAISNVETGKRGNHRNDISL